jgi:large subunit ribosomal protein L10
VVVENFGSLLSKTNFVVVSHYKGLSVQEISSLRKQIRNENATFKVTKNSLAKRAIKNTIYENLDPFFVGPTAITLSDDPVSAAKVIVNFSKENEKLTIIAGAMGDKELSISDIKKLASLPSMDVIRGMILGLITPSMSSIVSIIQQPPSKIVRLINSKPE